MILDADFNKLYKSAVGYAYQKRLTEFVKCGHVAAALMTDKGNIYTGIAITCAGQIGFCAEHSAIAEMLKNNESRISKIIAVNSKGIVPPCGRCREFIRMINSDNMSTEVMVSENNIVKLSDLLPYAWTLDSFDK